MLSPLHKHLLDDYQHDFPLTLRPYLTIAKALGVTENDVLTAFNSLIDDDFISRIGPIIPPNQLGKSTLVAMAIPPGRLEGIAEIISSFREVNHNYEREHRFNLWFVLIASSKQHLQNVIQSIERRTGFKTLQLPLLDEFFIDLGFPLKLDHD
ncbi:MAG: AsnC family protein [Gammaproteobacteria bacterium HGW-Gammaproteobacteria-3]|nr:MAG: AsnC family protein [Gammaproteobacteria bacterium HGW-Gammaproteobacteria-3]